MEVLFYKMIRELLFLFIYGKIIVLMVDLIYKMQRELFFYYWYIRKSLDYWNFCFIRCWGNYLIIIYLWENHWIDGSYILKDA